MPPCDQRLKPQWCLGYEDRVAFEPVQVMSNSDGVQSFLFNSALAWNAEQRRLLPLIPMDTLRCQTLLRRHLCVTGNATSHSGALSIFRAHNASPAANPHPPSGDDPASAITHQSVIKTTFLL